MFQFPGFPVPVLCVQTGLTGHDPSRVSPFGDPWICGWLTPPQGLSQSPTSFIGSWCQGIHRVLFFTCRRDARARYGVLKERLHASGCRPACSRSARPVPVVVGMHSRESERSLRAARGAHRVAGNCDLVTSPGVTSELVTGTPQAEIQRTDAVSSQWFT
jgi:hypothetical protein